LAKCWKGKLYPASNRLVLMLTIIVSCSGGATPSWPKVPGSIASEDRRQSSMLGSVK